MRNKFCQLSLSSFISQRACHINKGWIDFKEKLSDHDINQIVDILGGRNATKNAIRNNLKHNLNNIDNYKIFERLILEDEQWIYFAGQDYSFEIQRVRNILRK